jgi:CubicO group peptidase (beta-lactamase class C family)
MNEAFRDGRFGAGTNTVGVVVVRRGEIIAERYREGFDHRTPYRMWSAAKLLTNALTGVLVQRGALTLDEPAPIPEWAASPDGRANITVRHLLNMSSGLDPAGSGAYPVYHDGEDLRRVITNAHLTANPGARWVYANRDTLLLSYAMRASLGDEEYWRLPYRDVLDPLGMTNTVIETDAYGNYVMSSQVYSTPRDMARLGMLYLNDGDIEGQRILPEGWVRMSTTPAPARARGLAALMQYGVRGALGYGAQLWLYDKSSGLFDFDGYTAIGHRGGTVRNLVRGAC